jgi:GDP-4-dehydro-6-deoxy-D-mannose reductase
MRVAVTGARGFVGRWLTRELESRGHTVVAGDRPGLDVQDSSSTRAFLERAAPDAVAHLAAVSFAPDARAEPERAFETNVGGTMHLLEAVRLVDPSPAILVTGSSEVYGSPASEDLPLRESAPLRPRTPYGLSKAAQEAVAIAYARRYGLRAVVTRSFNHSGPGQRPVFVVPAVAARVLALRNGADSKIAVGNTEVRRDFTDVRDVVAAYVLLLEAAVDGRIEPGGQVLNVASGRSVAIRELIEELCRLAGVEPRLETDPALVRADDPPEIVGDAGELRRLTGWAPQHDVREMLAAVWADVSESPAGASAAASAGA